MYYSQQSPGMAQKLPNHHDQSAWNRAHHPILGPPSNVGPPPASPGYAVYTNGTVNPMQHGPHHPGHLPHTLTGHPTMPHHHHHQNSLTHYPSPPNGHALQQHTLDQGSPGSSVNQIITPHWQQQLLKCEVCRYPDISACCWQDIYVTYFNLMLHSTDDPFVSITTPPCTGECHGFSNSDEICYSITNPNLVKPSPETNGATKPDVDASASTAGGSESGSPSTTNAAANHPSSTVGPITEAPRPTTIRPAGNTWSSLDMGGVNIKNIPANSGLFSFTFLINLFLNHNALSVVPPELSKLRHLELLDLSGNNLTTVPRELGRLTRLKEFYLFDNNIQLLPPELGSLHQLQTLGIEGNPLDQSLKAIIQKDGTPALISYLRDSCPVPSPPPERVWKDLISQAERDVIASDPTAETFSVICYNILCEKYATERLYGYTPSWALAWDYRKELILTEVMNYNADFLCLQEVDIAQFEDYFIKHLKAQDYEGVHSPKSRYKTMNDADRRQVDGCATFYKASKYQLVEKQLIEFSAVAMQRQDFKKTDDMFNRVLGKDHIAIVCLLENRETGTRFIIANAHIEWNPAYRDVKLVQAALLLDEIDKVAASFAKYPPRLPPTPTSPDASPTTTRPPPVYTDGTKIPLIICGDFNSVPSEGVCEFLSNGTVPPNHPDFMSHTYGKYTSDGLKHRLGLKNAYAGAGDLLLTNYTPSFQGVIDYIWYSAANLAVNAVLGEVDRGYLEKVVGFPNAHFPSDHVCIISEFRVKPPRDTQARPVVFPNSSKAAHA